MKGEGHGGDGRTHGPADGESDRHQPDRGYQGFAGNKHGGHGLDRRPLEGPRRASDEVQRQDSPRGQVAPGVQDDEGGHGHRLEGQAEEKKPATVHPVGQRPRQGRSHHGWDEGHEGGRPNPRVGVGELVDQERGGQASEELGDPAQRLGGGEPGEGRVAKGAEGA